MTYLFQKEINNWSTWGAVYQSVDDFRRLIEEIFEREQLIGADQEIRTPSIVAAGTIVDKYEFKYLIMDYIVGHRVGDVIKEFTSTQKRHFIKQLLIDMEKLNTITHEEMKQNVIKERIIHNDRWNRVSPDVYRPIICWNLAS